MGPVTLLWQKVILGLVQGLTEFLPVSSSAHLILVPSFFRWEDPGLAFDVALHLGTLLAAVLYLREDLLSLATGVLRFSDESLAPRRRLLLNLILATVPGAIAGLLLEHKAEEAFRSPALIGWTLLGMGLAMGAGDRKGGGTRTAEEMTPLQALLIGAAQALALVPGVSRSGATITAALFLGLRRDEAARFSFLMAIPIIAGAGLLKMPQILHSVDKAGLAAGFAASALSGFLAIWLLLRYVRTRTYVPFVVYRVLLGLSVILGARFFL
jgi:undecaprenyl-diphosphatase